MKSVLPAVFRLPVDETLLMYGGGVLSCVLPRDSASDLALPVVESC
jgi:hypothetical protein